jgi:hypothetical protein
MAARKIRSLAERFHEKWTGEPNSGCWLWLATVGGDWGYGNIRKGRKGRHLPAHRVSWELHRGPIPDGMCVLHRCDVPSCVNPDHLYLGTNKDNTRDMNMKGRNGRTKLTIEQIRAIRADKRMGTVIARDYGISPPAVSKIRLRQSWIEV